MKNIIYTILFGLGFALQNMRNFFLIYFLFLSNIFSQDVIGEELYGQDLVDYLVQYDALNESVNYKDSYTNKVLKEVYDR